MVGDLRAEAEIGTGPRRGPTIFRILSCRRSAPRTSSRCHDVGLDHRPDHDTMMSHGPRSAEQGPKADPTTHLRPAAGVVLLLPLRAAPGDQAAGSIPLATIGVPTICMILLFLLPFYDRLRGLESPRHLAVDEALGNPTSIASLLEAARRKG